MCYAFNASIYVVGWGDAVQVIDIWFQAQEELDCGIYRNWGDFEARRTYLHDQIVVGLDAGVRGGGVDGVHIGSFQCRWTSSLFQHSHATRFERPLSGQCDMSRVRLCLYQYKQES